MCAKYCHIKANHCAVPAPLGSAEAHNATLVFGFTAGHILIQFTVSNSDKMRHPTALHTQPTTVKKRCDAAPFPHHLLLIFTFFFFFEKKKKHGGEKRGTVCPYP